MKLHLVQHVLVGDKWPAAVISRRVRLPIQFDVADVAINR